jgi:hypothetical protein
MFIVVLTLIALALSILGLVIAWIGVAITRRTDRRVARVAITIDCIHTDVTNGQHPPKPPSAR